MGEVFRGWKFPVEIDTQTGKFKTVEEEDDIREAVRIILTTKIGERINNPGFGSNLFKYIFESVDYTELKSIEYDVSKALTRWEPRITNIEVVAELDEDDSNRVKIDIEYETDDSVIPEELNFTFDVNEGFYFT